MPVRVARLLREARRAWHLWADRRARGAEGDGGEAFYRQMWRDAAASLGAEVIDLPGGFLEIRRGSAATRLWRQHVEIDHPATLQLAGCKPAVLAVLRASGLPVPDHVCFDLDSLRAALAFLGRGGPCVVKPARATGAGRGVTAGVSRPRDLVAAAYRASVHSRELLVERQVEGDSYRLLYLDGEMLDAVLRRPPSVVGDGRRTVRALVLEENRRRRSSRFAGVLRPIPFDLDMRLALRRPGLSLRSVPEKERVVPVKTVSNAGSERESESVVSRIGAGLLEEARQAAHAVRARLAGIDAITTDPARPLRETGGVVNEVNTTPGLGWHYAVRDPSSAVPVAEAVLRRLLAAT